MYNSVILWITGVFTPSGGGLPWKEFLHSDIFTRVISLENLFAAWREFRRGKRKKLDVQEFEFSLEDNLFELHDTLASKTYTHAAYESFYVQDPKLRHIHKACVRDRVAHQALFRILYPVFDAGFIFDSYSCRFGKGTHRAVLRLQTFARRLSENYRKPVFVLKCDVKKFFDSIDQQTLTALMNRKICDGNVRWFTGKIISSFAHIPGKGLPLGNVTSQLFANIYLNELDQFTKYRLKEKHYLRYCDDFIILGEGEAELRALIPVIEDFLQARLQLCLHRGKIIIRKFASGIDFLGYVAFPHHRILRTKTKQRMFRRAG